jgi:ribosomal protein S18 acetylase RimI-like enzyme
VRAAEERIAPGRLTVGVALDNPRARALYERLGYRGTGELATTTYAYVDDAGVTREATETDERLVKQRG